MSIASEISRIMTAKSDIASALATKGINVGSGKLQTYAPAIISATGTGRNPGTAPTGVVVPSGTNCTQPLYQKYSDIAFYTSGLISVLIDNGVTIPSGTRIDGLPALINAWTPGTPASATLNVYPTNVTIDSATHYASFSSQNSGANLIPDPDWKLDYPILPSWEFHTRIYWNGSPGENGAAAVLGHTDNNGNAWNNPPYLFISTIRSGDANYGRLCGYLMGVNSVIADDVVSSNPKLVSDPLEQNEWYSIYLGCRSTGDTTNPYQYYLKTVKESSSAQSEVTLNSSQPVRATWSGDCFMLLNNSMIGYNYPNYGTTMDLAATGFKANGLELWTAYGTLCYSTATRMASYGAYPDRYAAYSNASIDSYVPSQLSASDSWEIYMRVHKRNYAAFELSDTANPNHCAIGIYFTGLNTGYLRVYLKDTSGNVVGGGGGELQLALASPSSYWEYKLKFRNPTLTVLIRYDGSGSFSAAGTYNVSAGEKIDFGSSAMRVCADYSGELYSDRCYIKVGSSYLWCPSGMLYVPSDVQTA